jgi:SPP1 family predicted phage head-tail adaptor
VWAEFRKPSLKTVEATGTIVSELIREISIRYRADIRNGWRVLWGAKVFSVDHTYDYGKETTILVCKEVVK